MCKPKGVYDSFVLNEVFLMPTVKTVQSLHFLQLIQILKLCCRQKLQHPFNVKTWIPLPVVRRYSSITLGTWSCSLYSYEGYMSQYSNSINLINDFGTDALESKLLQCKCFLQGDREEGFPSMACTTFASSLERYFINLLHPKSHGWYILLPTL